MATVESLMAIFSPLVVKILFQMVYLTSLTSPIYVADAQTSEPLMPAMFVFGDSLTDPGNNNYIISLAKANFPPNGIDFPLGPTGRFCNGRTTADVIGQLMNQPFLPPYLAPTTQGTAILGGVNYASAAAGILDGSGADLIGRISFNQQIQYFANTVSQFQELLTPSVASQVLAKSLFYVSLGNNDYINNYLLADSPERSLTPQQFQDLLIGQLTQQLTELYNLGARKFTLFNVGPLGCIPSQIVMNDSPGTCVEFINGYVQGFNAALENLAATISTQLPGSIFIYANSYDLVLDKVNNPSNYGLTVVNSGCCGLGPYNGLVPCITGIVPCPDRTKYLFWDPFHPTDAVNVQLGQAFFSGPTSAISPINIQQLAAL